MHEVTELKRFSKLYPWLFSLVLLAFSAYALLDAFVIRRVYTTVEPTAPEAAAAHVPAVTEQSRTVCLSGSRSTEVETESGQAASAIRTENSYSDGSVSVSLQTYRAYNTTIYVADVTVASPEALQTAFAWNSFGRNVTAATSATAGNTGAVLAVNGDNYGSREKGYVIRNGVLYRDAAARDQEDLVVWADGSFSIVSESEVTAQALLDAGAQQVFSFGPGLLENGEIIVGARDEVDRAMASNPRTAVAVVEPGHYLLAVSDGRSDESEGLTLYELAEFLRSLGAQTAYNLDGGGSSTMVFLGNVVNTPSGRGGERAVTDILYFA